MKNLLSSLAVMLFVSASVLILGDSPVCAQMSIGGRIGLDIGSVTFSQSLPNGETNSTHTGILVGAQLDNWFSDMWAISVQLLYNQKGSSFSFSDVGTGVSSTTGTSDEVQSYLELPILVKFAFGSGDFKPYLFAGPSFGLLLSSTNSANGTSVSDDSDFNSLDISALVGVGASYRLGAGGPSLLLDVGDAFGLVNILKNGNTVTATGQSVSQSVKTNDIRIAAGIMFPL
jgi:hypothetical protein